MRIYSIAAKYIMSHRVMHRRGLALLCIIILCLSILSCEKKWDNPADPLVKLDPPIITVLSETDEAVRIALSHSLGDKVKIYYTLDGSEPSSGSELYVDSIEIREPSTLKAIACYDKNTSSSVSDEYSFTVSTPVFSVSSGTYFDIFSVEISCSTMDVQIRYTTDGSEPIGSSTLYSSAMDITQSTTLKAKAFKNGWITSSTATSTYTLTVSNPVISVPSGIYHFAFSTEILCSTPGTQIRYTTDGSEPSNSSTLYYNAIDITHSTTLKAKAFKNGWITSSAESVEYLILDMTLIPAGTFTMGDTRGGGFSDELPTHSVSLNSFYLGKYEVTQAEYAQYMQPSSNWTSSYGFGDTYPAYYVSWYDILKYCNLRSIAEGLTPVYSISGSTNPSNWGAVPTDWDATWNAAICNWNANGYRLPTEAEWEYSARGATNTPDYLYSGSDDINAMAWHSGNSGSTSHPVGTKAHNSLDLYDMSGNVYEWCWDWYGSTYYSSSPSSNPTGAVSGSYRVERGSSWSHSANYCRVANRSNFNPYISHHSIGFRLCRTGQ